MHIQGANNEELSAGICDFVQDFARGSRRGLERQIDNVSLQ
jgi:hypothetical protein